MSVGHRLLSFTVPSMIVLPDNQEQTKRRSKMLVGSIPRCWRFLLLLGLTCQPSVFSVANAAEPSDLEEPSNHKTRKFRGEKSLPLHNLSETTHRQLKKSQHKHYKKEKKHKRYQPYEYSSSYYYHDTPAHFSAPKPPTYYPPSRVGNANVNIHYEVLWSARPMKYDFHSSSSSSSSSSKSKKHKSHRKGKKGHKHNIFDHKYRMFKWPHDKYKFAPTRSPMTQQPTFISTMPATWPSDSTKPSRAPSNSTQPSTLPTVSKSPSISHVPTRSTSPSVSTAPTITPKPTFLLASSPTNAPFTSAIGGPLSYRPSETPSTAPSAWPSMWPSQWPSVEPSQLPSVGTAMLAPSVSNLPTIPPTTSLSPSISAKTTQSPTTSFSPSSSGLPSTLPSQTTVPSKSTTLSPTITEESSPEGATLSPTPNGWFLEGSSVVGENRADLFGTSVALNRNGTILAVGASLNDNGGTNAGHVRILQFNSISKEWQPMGQTIPGENRLDRFGSNVALSWDGLVMASSSPFHDGAAGPESGQVRLFVYNQSYNQWTQLGDAIDGEAAGDEAGYAIALAGDGRTVAIGSVLNKPDGESETGHVRVFQYTESGGNWTQIGSDIDGSQVGAYFGCSLSLSSDGTVLAVGAQFFDSSNDDTNIGQVQVYAYTGLDWVPFGSPAQGSAPGDAFGVSVSLSGDGRFLAAGSRRGNAGTGQVNTFFYSIATGTWRQVGSPINGKTDGESFGSTVSLSADGSTLAAGAPQASNLAGATRIYVSIDLEWFQVGEDIPGDDPGDESGAAVALAAESTAVAIGSPTNSDGGTNSGQIRVFRNPSN